MSQEGSQSTALAVSKTHSSALSGRFDHNLDPKKRITLPRIWRRSMGEPEFVYVMPDRKEKCLNLMPRAEMDAMLERLRAKSLFDPAMNHVLQVVGAMSEQLELDVQGRVRISDKFLRFANLTSTVAMIGAFKMIKLWNPAALAPEEEVDQKSLDEALAAAGL